MCLITVYSEPERKPYYLPDPRKELVDDLEAELCPECLLRLLGYLEERGVTWLKRRRPPQPVLTGLVTTED